MAHKYVCDKCGDEFAFSNKVTSISFPRADIYNVYHPDEIIKDLCDSCIKKLNTFMQPDAKQATK